MADISKRIKKCDVKIGKKPDAIVTILRMPNPSAWGARLTYPFAVILANKDIKVGDIKENDRIEFAIKSGHITIKVGYEEEYEVYDGDGQLFTQCNSGFSQELQFEVHKGINYFECGYSKLNKRFFGLLSKTYGHKLFIRQI